jgi:ubiquinone/menaquinone biosynthesis C-methylase UbiE
VQAVSDFKAFKDLERQGWSDPVRASGYVKMFAGASDQAIGSLVNAVNAKPKLKALDLCCGQGNVSEALARCGCDVTGVDFSPAMLTFANARVPNAVFISADAQELPFDNEEFDIVVSNLGVCHVPDQPRALLEARRVLRRGGRFAMTANQAVVGRISEIHPESLMCSRSVRKVSEGFSSRFQDHHGALWRVIFRGAEQCLLAPEPRRAMWR